MDNTKECIAKIEKEAEQKVKELIKNPTQNKDAEKSFIDIISSGAKKFEKEMGRPMTYSEMRDAFG